MSKCLSFLGFLLLGLAGCATPAELAPTPEATAAQGPALGKGDGKDQADRACAVVLREASRLPAENGDGYATKCVATQCNWVFAGHVDVAKEAYPQNADVRVLYHLQGSAKWWEVPAVPVPNGRPGFYSHAFQLSEHVIGPDASESELAQAKVELIPFIRLADGGRIFDHNRKKGDFDTYAFGQAEWFTIGEDQSCQPVVGTAYFQDDWQQNVGGALHAGSWLSVHYDLDRLPQCRSTHNGFPAWDTVAYVKFLPGGQLVSGSVREFVTVNGVPTNTALEHELQVKIPADATSMQLWFHNFSGAGSSCDTWDSNYGANYTFDVPPPIDDPRCQNVERWTQIYGGQPTCTSYTVNEQWDANNCELWLSSFAHGFEGHYGIPFEWLEAELVAGSQDGEILELGMLTRYVDPADGATYSRSSLGTSAGGNKYKTGFTYHSTGVQSLPSYLYSVQDVAFFIDVRRPSGLVVRLWQSQSGQNYDWNDAFGSGTTTTSIPYGNKTWANDANAIFDSRNACQ